MLKVTLDISVDVNLNFAIVKDGLCSRLVIYVCHHRHPSPSVALVRCVPSRNPPGY